MIEQETLINKDFCNKYGFKTSANNKNICTLRCSIELLLQIDFKSKTICVIIRTVEASSNKEMQWTINNFTQDRILNLYHALTSKVLLPLLHVGVVVLDNIDKFYYLVTDMPNSEGFFKVYRLTDKDAQQPGIWTRNVSSVKVKYLNITDWVNKTNEL